MTILALVLLGTLYPIVAEAMGEKISVGPPYYNKVAGPLALTLCLVMVAGPLLAWRRDDGKRLWSRLPLAVLAGALVLFGLILFGGRSEEHTSELQSLMRISYAVFCLKKKKYNK